MYIYYTHTEASSTVVDEVANYVAHKIFNTDLLILCSKLMKYLS